MIDTSCVNNLLKCIDTDPDIKNVLHITNNFQYEDSSGILQTIDFLLFANGIPLASIKCSDKELIDVPDNYKISPLIFNFSNDKVKYRTTKSNSSWNIWYEETSPQMNYHLESLISRKPNYDDKVICYLLHDLEKLLDIIFKKER